MLRTYQARCPATLPGCTPRGQGHLDDHWAAWLGDLTITRHRDGTSTLTGPVADQAQLHGVLVPLRDIGATLLSVNTAPVALGR